MMHKHSLADLNAILTPPSRASLDEAIARAESLAPGDGSLAAEDMETLLAAARLGQEYATDEVSRSWGIFQ